MTELKDMCDDVRPVGPDVLAEGRLRLIAAAGPGVGTSARRRPAFRRGWATGLVAVGAVAAVGAGVFVVGSGAEPTGTRPPAEEPVVQLASATEVLNRAADTARREADLNPRDDQYLVIRSVDGAQGGRQREIWKSVDGRKPSRLRSTPCHWDGKGSCVTDLGRESRPMTPGFYRTLPTDPDALQAWFRDQVKAGYTFEKGKPTLDDRIWKEMEDRLIEQYLPPKLRAAMFTMASRVAGNRVVNGVIDPAGRKAVVVLGPNRGQLVFDQRTFQFIGIRHGGKWVYSVLGFSVSDTAPAPTRVNSPKPIQVKPGWTVTPSARPDGG